MQEAWGRMLAMPVTRHRKMVGGVVAVMCAKEAPTERLHAAAVLFALASNPVGQVRLRCPLAVPRTRRGVAEPPSEPSLRVRSSSSIKQLQTLARV
jgi:hypothetical protein